MNKIKPGSGHLDSSAAHRTVQASTILDRRYVKRPTSTNAGKYSSATRNRSNNVAPSRLINLGVHSTDLEVAQIKEAIHEEVVEEGNENIAVEGDFLTEDALALNLEVAEATVPDESEEMVEQTTIENPEITQPESSSTNYSDNLNSNYAGIEPEEESSPVSMYALETMKRSMMQDLVSNSSSSPRNNPITETYSNPSSAHSSDQNYQCAYYQESSQQNYTTPTDGYSSSMLTTMPTENSMASPATGSTPESIDMISKATSDALASIRIATESADVSDQMASLKAFASSIKSDAPEMAELSNTIEKFANVAMKSTKAKEEAENKVALSVSRSPRIAQSSSRISRTSTSIASPSASHTPTSPARPTITRSPKVASLNRTTTSGTSATHRPAARPATRSVATAKKSTPRRSSPDNRTLEQALRSVATMDDDSSATKSKKSRSRSKVRRKGGFTRFALALGCASACIAAIVYFVGANIPDISVQVAAMQTGIDAAYPSYIPRDYSLGDISSENGRLTMRFNGPNGSSFTLIEEKSSWDSSALQRNYVEPTWGDNFTTTHEQGITIFLCNSDAAWVNGGILYKITSTSNDLTKKQLRNIVTSI